MLKAKLMTVLALLIVTFLVGCDGEPVASVVLVRHAEKADNSDDPPLSPAGVERANALKERLETSNIAAIFVTRYRRTQQTAAPLARHLQLTPIQYTTPEDVVQRVLSQYPGRAVLIVGHSNTVPQIIEEFGANPQGGIPNIPENEYDNLFIVFANANGAGFIQTKYGAPS